MGFETSRLPTDLSNIKQISRSQALHKKSEPPVDTDCGHCRIEITSTIRNFLHPTQIYNRLVLRKGLRTGEKKPRMKCRTFFAFKFTYRVTLIVTWSVLLAPPSSVTVSSNTKVRVLPLRVLGAVKVATALLAFLILTPLPETCDH